MNRVLGTSHLYECEVDEFCERAYEKIYQSCYYQMTNTQVKNLRNRIMTIIRVLFNKVKLNDLFLYHNIVIETHRFICTRAIFNR